jgi:hypothetical protein
MATVLCMKWGTVYGPDYVNKLHGMVARHLARPHRFLCLTDDTSGIEPGIETAPLPEMRTGAAPHFSGWRKLSSFSPALGLEGPVLFLDLDLVIVDSIDVFFDHPGAFCIIENWTQLGQGIGNSSVYRYEGGKHADILERFEADPDRIIADYPNEQVYLTRMMAQRFGEPTFWPETWCRSFKRHCLPGGLMRWVRTPSMPEGARIIVFHGHPKPPEAAEGIWPQRFKKVRPTPWISEHWR